MADTETHPLDKKKPHRERKSGHKAQQKKKKHDVESGQKQPNPKAFSFNSAVKAERRFRRKQDIDTKKQHIPLIDRTPIEPPPLLVAIVGPPKVGKTTLMNSLIKLYTKSPVTSIKGPVTIVIGKKQRITLMECNNDINSMIDIAKVADIVLLLSDANFGFEMEMFEFINICQVHGMPRIMGVLTHLDMIKNNKTLRNTKKVLKHRFWTEVFNGAKLFYLSGILHEEYLRNEVRNLARFISVMKLRPILWRSSHSYLIADRYQDLTYQDVIRKNPKCDRNVCLYGYVRGIPFKKDNSVHIAGMGDMQIKDISFLPDPCPLPEVLKKRALVEKEKLIYAPFSGVGGIVYDKDAVYFELGGSHSYNLQRDKETNEVVNNILNSENDTQEKIENIDLKIFMRGKTFTAQDADKLQNVQFKETNSVRRKAVFAQSDEELLNSLTDDKCMSQNESDDENYDSENEEDNEQDDPNNTSVKWKENLTQNATEAFLIRQNEKKNLMKLVYGVFDHKEKQLENQNPSDTKKELIGGLFQIISHEQQKLQANRATMDSDISSLFEPWNTSEKNWLASENKVLIENCFVTGKWKSSEDAEELLKLDDAEDLDSDSSEMYGDFEDLETGEKYTSTEMNTKDDKQYKRKRTLEEDEEEHARKIAEKKQKLKEKFCLEYDNTDKNYYEELKSSTEKQSQINKTIFENLEDEIRVQLEGYRPGMYVRIEFENLPCEFVNNFDPTYPIVIGALNRSEENVGYVNVQIKKHRWYKKILKTNDPLIVSLGWRRFQTIPIYSKLEDDLKFRYLKYTPEHVTCKAHFWGPITPQGAGFVALQSCDENSELKQGFRIAATGSVQELVQSTQIVKKLKLIGEPAKIYKKTAFIKGMFSSSIEVGRFEGARIKTVSGIRGQIKKAVTQIQANLPEGTFRATFEDKILLSDIIFLRTWVGIQVKQFYNPVTTLLLPPEKKNSWQGMKTTGEIKRENGLRNQPNVNSLYKEIVREEKPLKPLVIPRKLQEALPYKDKPKTISKSQKKEQRVAVIREPYEHRRTEILKKMTAIAAHKEQQKQKEKEKQKIQHKKEKEQQEHLQKQRQKERLKRNYAKQGKI